MDKWIYDIYLPGFGTVGNSGDEIFDTEEEARADADDFIISYLADEYKSLPREFDVYLYKNVDFNANW